MNGGQDEKLLSRINAHSLLSVLAERKLIVLSFRAMKAQLAKSEAIRLANGVKSLAEIFGISSSAVSQWGEWLPASRVWQLRCLRPDWFPISPQTANTGDGLGGVHRTFDGRAC